MLGPLAPSKKSETVPVGVPSAPLTVAVKVTVCPATAGFTDEGRVVVVSDWVLTTRTRKLDRVELADASVRSEERRVGTRWKAVVGSGDCPDASRKLVGR